MINAQNILYLYNLYYFFSAGVNVPVSGSKTPSPYFEFISVMKFLSESCKDLNVSFNSSSLLYNESNSSGGGLYISNSSAVFTNVTISNNKSDSNGGGLYLESSNSNSTFINITVTSNEAEGYAGGIYCSSCNATFDTLTVSGNESDQEAGGIYIDGSSSSV